MLGNGYEKTTKSLKNTKEQHFSLFRLTD